MADGCNPDHSSFLLILGWKRMGSYNMRQDWKAILFYSIIVIAVTQGIYFLSEHISETRGRAYRGPAAGFRSRNGYEACPYRQQDGGEFRYGNFLFLHVPRGNEHAAVHWH